MNTTTGAIPSALSLTVTGATATLSHTGSTTLLVALAPPANPTATASGTQVALSWLASINATSYHVKRASVSGGPYSGVSCTTGTSFTDTGLSSGTYYYVVSAGYSSGFNAGGESADSVQTSATVAPQPTAAPTNVKAVTGKPKGSINLSWTQSVSPGVTQNNVYRRTATGSYPTAPTVTRSATTTYLDNKLTGGTQYCYVVTAVSSAGESEKSPQACAIAK